jgi:hypothetical protein
MGNGARSCSPSTTPPFSGGGGHTGSGQMLKDLDEAFNTAGIAPDAVLSGHAHNYQRFTRTVTVGGKKMDRTSSRAAGDTISHR